MTDAELINFGLQVLEKGGPLAFSFFAIVVAWLKFGRPQSNPVEAQMTQALRSLEAKVDKHHETAQAAREEMKDSISDLGQRVARIEGRIEK